MPSPDFCCVMLALLIQLKISKSALWKFNTLLSEISEIQMCSFTDTVLIGERSETLKEAAQNSQNPIEGNCRVSCLQDLNDLKALNMSKFVLH